MSIELVEGFKNMIPHNAVKRKWSKKRNLFVLLQENHIPIITITVIVEFNEIVL